MQHHCDKNTKGRAKRASSLWLATPDTVTLVTNLAKLGADRSVVMNLLGCDTGRHRIRRMLDAVSASWRGGVRVVSSPAWYLANPQRMIDATIIVLGYLNLRERHREAGVRCDAPLEMARLHIDTYRLYLALKHTTPVVATIPIKRAVLLIKLYRNGVFTLRRCHGCESDYLDAVEQVDRGMCRSCEIEHDMFCERCGTPVRSGPSRIGRLARRQVCASCKT